MTTVREHFDCTSVWTKMITNVILLCCTLTEKIIRLGGTLLHNNIMRI